MDLGSWSWKGLFSRALEFPSGVIPGVFTAEVSPTQRCRLRYNDVLKALELSVDGGAYVALGTSLAGGGWTDDGTNVRLTTAADTVSIGTATPIAGTKVVISAPQLVTAGLDTTQGLDLSIVRSAPLVSGEFVTAFAIHPSGNVADASDSFVTGIFADVPTGTADTTVLFVLGDVPGGNFWEQVILSNDNDIVISAVRQTPGGPNDIVLTCLSAAPSGEIRLETDITGVPVVHLRATDDGAAAASAWAQTGEITPAAVAISQNDYSPTGLNSASIIYQDNNSAPAANINITGLAGGRAGREITIFNVSADPAQTITLTHDDAASLAGNRFFLPGGAAIVIPQFGSVTLHYRTGATPRWFVKAVAI